MITMLRGAGVRKTWLVALPRPRHRPFLPRRPLIGPRYCRDASVRQQFFSPVAACAEDGEISGSERLRREIRTRRRGGITSHLHCRSPAGAIATSDRSPSSSFLFPRRKNPAVAYNCYSSSSRSSAAAATGTARRSKKKTESQTSSSSSTKAAFVDGPSIRFGTGRIANQALTSVVGTSGSTVVLSTVSSSSASDGDNRENSFSGGDEAFLTVEYRERQHGVGAIPTGNKSRKDYGIMSDAEILGSRAVDRSLRPLFAPPADAGSGGSRYHVHASVQACGVAAAAGGRTAGLRGESGGHPVALAINSSSASLMMSNCMKEPVAATTLTVLRNGKIVQNAFPYHSSHHEDGEEESEVAGHLLYSGTRDSAIMMEWFSSPSCAAPSPATATIGLPESEWEDLLKVAHACIQPVLNRINDACKLQQQHQQQLQQSQPASLNIANDSDIIDDREEETRLIRASLGLPPLPQQLGEADDARDSSPEQDTILVGKTDELVECALRFCEDKGLGIAALCLFGCDSRSTLAGGGNRSNSDEGEDVSQHARTSSVHQTQQPPQAYVHASKETLLSKQVRGRREQVLQQEIASAVREFIMNKNDSDEGRDGEDNIISNSSDDDNELIGWLTRKVSYRLLQRGLYTASKQYGCRADLRCTNESDDAKQQGCNTIRTIEVQIPALPDSVHGSATFSRGDTAVLCTVTLGPPREGLPRTDPYRPAGEGIGPGGEGTTADEEGTPSSSSSGRGYYETLPVGSLRFLRTQEVMVSDLNSRKVRADKERTGDSGSLAEVQRAFLQYDFPAYSTGEVPAGGNVAHRRRSLGHGALAERAILPVLPPSSRFPYAIRMTSEVTDSNGSSSMASVCGSTIALLDAGVPISAPVAGVSVGLAPSDEGSVDGGCLLLDITGTEDFYGALDMKVAGTRDGITALQMDVKKPLSIHLIIEALHMAKAGRLQILKEMNDQASSTVLEGLKPRPQLKWSAPSVELVRFDPQRKRDLIGPAGVVLRQMEERYNVSLDLTQEGQCLIFGSRSEVAKAKSTVMDLVADVVEGEIYTGTVIEVKDFGAIVELLRNKEGILHASELADTNDDMRNHPEGVSGFVRKFLRVGEEVEVVCIGVDPVAGSIKLSRKALLERRKNEQAGLAAI